MQSTDFNAANESPTQILHPGSRQLFRYWEGLRAERPCPDKAEFQLSAIKTIVQNLVVIERARMGQWRYRLAGGAVCDLLQGNMTGKDPLTGYDSFESEIVNRTLDTSYSRLQPVLFSSRHIGTDDTFASAETIIMPVSDENSGKVLLYGGLFGFSEGERFGALQRRQLTAARVIWTEHELANHIMAKVHHRAPPVLHLIQGGKV